MKTIITIVILVAVVILGLFLFFDDKNNTETIDIKGMGEGNETVFKDYDGNDVRLSDFRGKAIVVNSWAVWCPFCKEELPDFAELQKEFGDDIIIIAINRGESLSKTKGFTDLIGATDELMFLIDANDSFYKSIGGFTMPETIFVDREGNIVKHKRGFMRIDEIRILAQSIL